MKKIILSGVLLLLCGGCVIHWEDDNAAGAVKEYQRLLTAKAPEILNLAGAAALSPVFLLLPRWFRSRGGLPG